MIRQSRMPACLLELAFVSNLEEERLLADTAFRLKAAEAIAEGLDIWMT